MVARDMPIAFAALVGFSWLSRNALTMASRSSASIGVSSRWPADRHSVRRPHPEKRPRRRCQARSAGTVTARAIRHKAATV